MPYQQAAALTKLKAAQTSGRPLKLAFLDIDGTVTGAPNDQVAVRTLLENSGYVIVFVTHRSSELCLSQTALTSADEFKGLLDPDIIAGKLGNEIVVRQIDGRYKTDASYTKPVSSSPEEWPPHKQEAVDHIVAALCSQLSISPADFLILLVGDNLPDLPMGLLSAAGSRATFIIPGGALLRKLLFSEPYLSQYPLTPEENGFYHFSPTNRGVVVGDEAFPGTTGPTTLLAWLKNQPVL